MKNIKTLLDPNNILNPGKILTLTPKCEGRLPHSRKEIKDFN